MPEKMVRTTITLPLDLKEAADKAIREGKVKSRNELVAVSLRHELALLERASLDTAFSGMANDAAYLAEVRQIALEFARSDWEALGQGDKKE